MKYLYKGQIVTASSKEEAIRVLANNEAENKVNHIFEIVKSYFGNKVELKEHLSRYTIKYRDSSIEDYGEFELQIKIDVSGIKTQNPSYSSYGSFYVFCLTKDKNNPLLNERHKLNKLDNIYDPYTNKNGIKYDFTKDSDLKKYLNRAKKAYDWFVKNKKNIEKQIKKEKEKENAEIKKTINSTIKKISLNVISKECSLEFNRLTENTLQIKFTKILNKDNYIEIPFKLYGKSAKAEIFKLWSLGFANRGLGKKLFNVIVKSFEKYLPKNAKITMGNSSIEISFKGN